MSDMGEKKHAGGRPSKYKPEYCLAIKAMARLGMTDAQMSKEIGVALSTFALWKKEHPEFMESLEEGIKNRNEPIEQKIRGSGKQRKRNKAAAHKYYKKYYKSNKLKYYKNAEKRRNQKQGVLYNFPSEIWDELKIYFDMSCAYCGNNSEPLHKDHIVPLSKGGPLVYGNVLPVCKRCNSSKRDENMETWYKAQPFYDTDRYSRIMEYVEHGKNI